MFEQFNETMKDAMKPVTDLATLNMSTMQDLAEKQNTLLSTLLSDGMAFVEKASQQKDVMSLAEAQKAYFEGFQETLTDAAPLSLLFDFLSGQSEPHFFHLSQLIELDIPQDVNPETFYQTLISKVKPTCQLV